MINESRQYLLTDGVIDFLGDASAFVSDGMRKEIEIDYAWDWEKDPNVTGCLVAEWENLNRVMAQKLTMSNATVLVIGGGGKHFFKENSFPNDIKDLILLNPSKEELAQTPKYPNDGTNIFLLRAIAEQNPLIDEVADALIISSTLDHVLDADQTIREAKRVLVPGGMIAITLGNHRSWYKVLFKTLRIPRMEDHAHTYHFSISDVVALLSLHEFTNIEYRATSYLRIPRRVELLISKIGLVKLYMFISNNLLPLLLGKTSGGMFVVWAQKKPI